MYRPSITGHLRDSRSIVQTFQHALSKRRSGNDRQLLVLEPYGARIDDLHANVLLARPIGKQTGRQDVV